MMNKISAAATPDSDWKSLYKIGGLAALLAGALFRRNIAAELGLFSEQPSPLTVDEWFMLLQNNRLLGLSYLNAFDIVNYALLSLMFLALYAVLNRTNKSYMLIAAALGLVGIAVYFASNTAFSMLALSSRYAAATSDAQRTMLLSAGEALLVINRFTGPSAQPGSGGYMSLLLIAIAGMMTSIVMLRSNIFQRSAAYVGILASTFDLAYCLAFVFVPALESALLAVIFIPAAGFFLMIWHIMIGWKLYQLGK